MLNDTNTNKLFKYFENKKERSLKFEIFSANIFDLFRCAFCYIWLVFDGSVTSKIYDW